MDLLKYWILEIIDVGKRALNYEGFCRKCRYFIQCFWESDLGIQLSFLINKYLTMQIRIIIVIVFILVLRYYICKNASKILRLPRFLFDWQKKGHYKYHVFINIYLYGGATMERKYDREAFTIEEQVFQQCVPVRALNKYAERKYGTMDDAIYDKLKRYSTKFDLPFRDRYT